MAHSTGGVAAPRVSNELRPAVNAASWLSAEPSRFDLDTFFILQKGNLAVLHESQALLADAIHSIARIQHSYLEQLQRDFSPAAAVGRGSTVARDIVGLVANAQARIAALLARGARLNLDR